MKLKDLKRKLDLISEDYDDFNVLVDDLQVDGSLLTLESVNIGSAWNIILSCDGDEDHRPDPDGAAGEVRRAPAERSGAPAAGPHRL